MGQLHQSVRRRLGLRRLSRERLRARGREGRPVRISAPGLDGAPAPGFRAAGRRPEIQLGRAYPRATCHAVQERQRQRPRAATRVDRTPKMYIGGKQVRPDGALHPDGAGCQRHDRRAGRRWQPQGHPRRGRGGACRAPGQARLGDAARLQPLADPVLHRRKPGCPQRGVRRADRGDDRPLAEIRPGRSGCGGRAAVHLRRLGRQIRRHGAGDHPARHHGRR